MKYAIKG